MYWLKQIASTEQPAGAIFSQDTRLEKFASNQLEQFACQKLPCTKLLSRKMLAEYCSVLGI